MSVKVRFAPSPTGYLHAGNVRTALVNWLFAHKLNGHFLLRIDDTDAERSKPEYVQAIEEDMRWLGLNWDSEEHQSTRFGRYAAAASTLTALGRLYACYETPDELDVQRKMLASRGLPPIYNRAGLKLTDEQKKTYESQGRRPHYRFLLQEEEIGWHDLIRGPVAMKATTMSDPVLLREDGPNGQIRPVYTLASVVDDGELGITHVIRGEDHVSNTAVQVQLYKVLGFAVPQFAHMALLKTKEGELSKRVGGNDIRSLREAGILPMAVNSLLSRIGTSQPVEPVDSLEELAESFDFATFGRAPAIYDVSELERLNAKLLHGMEYGDAMKVIGDLADEQFWYSIRSNISSLAEAREWWGILHGQIEPELNHDDRTFLRSTIALLPSSPWNETTYDAWLAAIKPTTKRKGKELFLPIRKALTGLDHGPELKKLLPLLGREQVLQRLGKG